MAEWLICCQNTQIHRTYLPIAPLLRWSPVWRWWRFLPTLLWWWQKCKLPVLWAGQTVDLQTEFHPKPKTTGNSARSSATSPAVLRHMEGCRHEVTSSSWRRVTKTLLHLEASPQRLKQQRIGSSQINLSDKTSIVTFVTKHQQHGWHVERNEQHIICICIPWAQLWSRGYIMKLYWTVVNKIAVNEPCCTWISQSLKELTLAVLRHQVLVWPICLLDKLFESLDGIHGRSWHIGISVSVIWQWSNLLVSLFACWNRVQIEGKDSKERLDMKNIIRKHSLVVTINEVMGMDCSWRATIDMTKNLGWFTKPSHVLISACASQIFPIEQVCNSCQTLMRVLQDQTIWMSQWTVNNTDWWWGTAWSLQQFDSYFRSSRLKLVDVGSLARSDVGSTAFCPRYIKSCKGQWVQSITVHGHCATFHHRTYWRFLSSNTPAQIFRRKIHILHDTKKRPC